MVKSLSKVYALSGLRAGYLVAHAALCASLAQWFPPWAVSLPAQVAVIEALQDSDYYQARYAETHQLREELAASLAGFTVFSSVANFLLVAVHGSAAGLVQELRQSGIYVRNCDSMSDQFDDRFIRVAVRGPEQNRRLAEAIRLTAGAPARSEALR